MSTSLNQQLLRVLPAERVSTRLIDRLAFANDASVYRRVPRAVAFPETVDEVCELLRLARRLELPVTFRSAGTSLSGQAVTDGLLVVLSRHWNAMEILDGGRRVRVQPGVIAGMVNRRLAGHGAKIGPDPASIQSCMMGGVLANNSSGMCCGVIQNAYHTLDSMRFVLADGTTVDSADPDADRRLREDAPALAEGLLDLRRRIHDDAELLARVRRKYRLKNTMGYSLNAFVDYERPVEILTHLMIGSEGTFGFIADAVLHTVPDDPFKYTGLLFFGDVPAACAAVAPLRDSGARALELMDRASLRAIADEPGVPACIAMLPPDGAALLVEYQCPDVGRLEERIRACAQLLKTLPLASPPEFTRDAERQAVFWKVRKGLIPSVGAMRRRGTSFIIEDVVFPPERLADGVGELQALFADHGYDDAIVFGHAKDGNLHFVLTQAFDRPEEVHRYDGFMRALASLVTGRYEGALKAEHGTGRNMAPFVETEWGADAYAIMRELKRLIDPTGLLNPGVVINDDPQAHVKDLKALPQVEPEVDACIECGFCERMCPSRNLTMTPRQRIVVRREMARLAAEEPDSAQLAELRRDYRYEAVETCATDGLCALACPVRIDTGSLVRRLRREAHGEAAQGAARWAAGRFDWLERAARTGLRAGRLVGWKAGGELPAAAVRRPALADGDDAAAVVFPSCVSRVVGPAEPAQGSATEALLRVAGRAGVPVRLCSNGASCCGLAFASKGFDAAASRALEGTIDRLWSATDEGRLPVVVDNSPCALACKEPMVPLAEEAAERHGRIRWLDSIEFAHDVLLERLTPRPLPGAAALHPVCSVRKMALEEKLTAVMRACHETVEVPFDLGCCGFAGDLGFRRPELTRAAMRDEAAELAAGSWLGLFSSSRTCEIGLQRACGRPVRSFWHALDEATGGRTPAGS